MQQFNLGSPVSACATSSLSGLLLEARIAPDSQKLVTAFQRIEFKPVADVAYRVIPHSNVRLGSIADVAVPSRSGPLCANNGLCNHAGNGVWQLAGV